MKMEQQAQSAQRLPGTAYKPNWRKWHAAGFGRELMPIIPVGATLSPASNVKAELLGKVPGMRRDDGWVGFGGKWAEKLFPRAPMLQKWDRWGAGIGAQARKLNCADVDANDAAIVDALTGIVVHICGQAPTRYRDGSPRRALMYRVANDTVIRKWRIEFNDGDGARHAFEWLGYGQYWNIDGLHPSGEPYKWHDPHPCDVGFDNIPVVTAEQVAHVRNAIIEYIEMMGFTLLSSSGGGTGSSADAKKLSDPSLHAPTAQLVLDVLAAVPCNDETFPSRDDFVNVLRSIKASLGGAHQEHWPAVLEWALQYPGAEADYIEKIWESFDDSALGWSYLSAWAHGLGFSGDAQHDFADPPYDPKSFFEIDERAVRSRSGELAILKAGWPAAYEEVRAELDRRSTIAAADLDALIAERGAPDEAPPRTKRPKAYLLDELSGLAEVHDFVEGFLCDGQSSVIYGDTNVGKSFFALDLALHVALGREWFGKQVDRGAVVYVAGEGGGGMKRRIEAFLRRHGIDQTKDIPFALIPDMIDFRDKRGIRGLIEALHELRVRVGLPVRLIIVDTLSRALAGGNENASDDMGALVRGADQVRSVTGAHLSFVHHTGKDDSKGARGHSLLKAAVDTEIEVRRHDETKGAVKVTVTKQRDLEIGAGFAFRRVNVELGMNAREKPITSCVIEPATIKPVLDEAEQEASEILRTMQCESEAASVQIADWRTAILSREDLLTGQTRDTKKRQWQRLRDSLKKKGIIEVSGSQVWLKNQ